MLSFALAMSVLLASSQNAPAVPAARPLVVSYADSVACAGVTQAGSELEGNESDRGRRLFDAALYWSLTTIQMGTTSGRPDNLTERDLANARIRSVRELSRRTPATLDRLEKCVKSAPSFG